MHEAEISEGPLKLAWHEVAYVLLSFSVVVLTFSAGYNFVSLFADGASDTERWVVTLTSGFMSLGAALIAYLTAREVRLNDADKKIQKADLDRALADNKECKEDRKKLHSTQARMQRKIERLMDRMHVVDDERDDVSEDDREKDDEARDEDDERRNRRKADGSKQSKPLPPEE